MGNVNFDLNKADDRILPANPFRGMGVRSYPKEVVDACAESLKKIGVAKTLSQTSKSEWGVAYQGLAESALHSVWAMCIAESLGQIAVGSTQRTLDTLVASLPPTAIPTFTASPGSATAVPTATSATVFGMPSGWLLAGVGAVGVGVAVWYVRRKKKRGRR